MVITPSGSANWGTDLSTSYDATGMHTNRVLTSGIWNNGGIDDGPLLLEDTQVGAVVYRVDGGAWHEVTSAPITNEQGKHVEIAYNERPGFGSHVDNSGSLSITVVRTKS
jgi:C-terminal processing protease CtpA/Prc